MIRGSLHALRCALTILCLAPAAAGGADLSSLYDPATLEATRPSYERTTTKIFDQIVSPALLTEEKQRLGNVRLDFRLQGEGSSREHPLQFYAVADGSRIVAPIASLKFLDDLCTAYAWLQINGYGLETISEYAAMLRYQSFPDGRYPRPLLALRIPSDALRNPRVDELALGHFVTARTFILLHELGHVYYRHRGSTIANEEQADRFAAEVMARTPLPPLGIIVFFLFDAHWSSYPPGPADTHPMSGARLQALAGLVEDGGLAAALRKLGGLLDDPEIRAGFAATGLAANLAALAPRRPGELPRAGPAPAAGVLSGSAFQGRYVGQSLQFNEPTPYPIAVTFRRRGDQVDGEYSFGLGVGSIHGRVAGNTLTFEWEWARNYGRGVFNAAADGSSFHGTWGYRKSPDNAGRWEGGRAE